MDMDQVKINRLEIENVKRVRAVRLEPSPNGLTIVGGKNRQGKTSVLDAIAWALGGNKFRPSAPQNNDSVIPPTLKVTLSNGLIVERKGKNSDLKITDPSGTRSGQRILDSFISELALDLPRFMGGSDKDKADTLLQVLGIGDRLAELELAERETYNQRRAIGQIADQKEKYAKEQVYYPDAPKEPVSASDLIRQQQDILARNGENQRKRRQLRELQIQHESTRDRMRTIQQQITDLQQQLKRLNQQWNQEDVDIITAQKSAEQLQDESTAELEQSILEVDTINAKVRANLSKDKAEQDAQDYRDQYAALTAKLEDIRSAKTALLDHADLPLPGLSVDNGRLLYQGQPWDCMSGADQLRVATAIVRKLNPRCGFVLLDKLEQMDQDTLNQFGQWLEHEGLQAIATRVSTGGECSIIIEDGIGIQSNSGPVATEPAEDNTNKRWEAKY